MDKKTFIYRKLHPKCIYCKYFKGEDYFHSCAISEKIIEQHSIDLLRLCPYYEVKGGEEHGPRNKFDENHVLSLCEESNSVPYIEAHVAVDELCRYFLGEDWYDDTSVQSPGQVNFHIVCEIEKRYKGCKRKRK